MLKRFIEEIEDFIPYIVTIFAILIIMPVMLAITMLKAANKNSNSPSVQCRFKCKILQS